MIAGDGVGVEVTDQALKVLRAADQRFALDLEIEELDYGAERYLRDGTTLPSGEIDRLAAEVDAIYLGALGDPRIPDMRHARDILLALRFELDLYINLRPIRCLADRFSPLKGKSAAQIDMLVLRENTEGIYVGVGGNFKKGSEDEIAINEDINTFKGVDRILRAAFTAATRRASERGCSARLVMSDKHNAMPFAHGLWQRRFEAIAGDTPGVDARHLFVDVLAMELIRAPEQFDVIVTNNLFGDIITDLGAQLQGGMGMAASANLHPDGVCLFEPVHGSAPPLAGKDVANPVAAILTVELMLNHLGLRAAATAVGAAVGLAVQENRLTVDVGGGLGTSAVGDFIAEAVAAG